MRDSRIKVKHITNSGVSNARNIGLRSATGEYITFVDSDDWIDCCYIENWVRIASQHAGDVFIGGYIEEYNKLLNGYMNIDKMIIDELEPLFMGLY